MRTFPDRVAVVTGGASGIGRALAERFASEGMKVVLADVEEAALADAEGALRAQGAEVLAVRTDVARADDVAELAERTLEAFGAVHIVCNNAGVGGDMAFSWEQTPENWEWVLGVNLWGVIHGVRTFVPILLRQGDEGHVINTASMAGHLSLPLGSVYHATKFAVVTLTESLHYELSALGARVRASVLCPGFVRTAILESDRNRPTQLSGATHEMSVAEKEWRDAYRELLDQGLPPTRVADVVLDAIREERFWVFPHPEMLEGVRARMEGILSQTNPKLDLPLGLQERLKV